MRHNPVLPPEVKLNVFVKSSFHLIIDGMALFAALGKPLNAKTFGDLAKCLKTPASNSSDLHIRE